MLNKIMTLVASLLIIALVSPKIIAAENTMAIAYPEFFPFFSKNEEKGVNGFFYEIITEALDHRMGIRTTWTEMPWKRCQEQVYSGRYDAMITVPTKERSLYCDTHPDPFYLKELKVFTYLGHPGLGRINAVSTMADIKTGDLVIEWPVGAAANIKISGVTGKIIETDVSLESMPFHLLISKKSKFNSILFKFNDVIRSMFNDGTMQRILSAYD